MLLAAAALGAVPQSFEAAAAFGARPGVADLSLSPDGKSVAYVAPASGQGSILYTLRLDDLTHARPALFADGKPQRLDTCKWVANERLACIAYGVVRNAGLTRNDIDLLPFTRLWAVNADGSNLQQLSHHDDVHTRGLQLFGGDVIDWMPESNGTVLMCRNYLPDDHIGSKLGSVESGLGVDLIDTRTLKATIVEHANPKAIGYLSDGHGAVRILATEGTLGATGQSSGVITYYYRKRDSQQWLKLSEYNEQDRSGFEPAAIDHDLDLVFGFQKLDGRLAAYSHTLDGALTEQLVYARADVDIDGLVQIGRRQRVVGVTYATDMRHAEYFDPEIRRIVASLEQALPTHPPVRVVDSSIDESKLLIVTASDTDPGVYYLYDRASHKLQTFLVVRGELEGVQLATVKPVSYPAGDGTMIPAYLTLPPGSETGKDLPAIVLPHGGPGARDEWGFDWLSQFFAARGFAVLQPNFRGSIGYGDAWYEHSGFRSWPAAIGDVLDAGRWLVAQGIADPHRLGIVGWSYGGYAALQSAVVDPALFKAVVAIAPVTDLQRMKDDHWAWSDHHLVSEMIGNGAQVSAGSPALNAARIKAPVLLFHGAFDRNVSIEQSRSMAASLKAAHVPHELVTWDELDHYLDDSVARAQMLRKTEEFLRQSFGR